MIILCVTEDVSEKDALLLVAGAEKYHASMSTFVLWLNTKNYGKEALAVLLRQIQKMAMSKKKSYLVSKHLPVADAPDLLELSKKVDSVKQVDILRLIDLKQPFLEGQREVSRLEAEIRKQAQPFFTEDLVKTEINETDFVKGLQIEANKIADKKRLVQTLEAREQFFSQKNAELLSLADSAEDSSHEERKLLKARLLDELKQTMQ